MKESNKNNNRISDNKYTSEKSSNENRNENRNEKSNKNQKNQNSDKSQRSSRWSGGRKGWLAFQSTYKYNFYLASNSWIRIDIYVN